MKQIALTNGGHAMVDDWAFDFLSRWDWWEKDGYAVCSYGGKILRMHRAVMLAPDNLHVDHIDGNPLNNQTVNLRLADSQGNAFNRRKSKTKAVAFKGVYLNAGKFEARIKAKGQHYYLGRFDTAEDAAMAYDKKARELHGSFASLNFQ